MWGLSGYEGQTVQERDKGEFLAVLTGLASIKRVQLTKEALDLWWLTMGDWPIDEFKQAAAHLLRAHEWMPSPHNFEALRKAGRPTAGEAWSLALRHAASSGYRSGPLNDPLVDAVTRAIGGYEAIAMCNTDKLGFLERRFCEHYEQMQDADDVREAVPQIAHHGAKRLAGPKLIGALLPSVMGR